MTDLTSMTIAEAKAGLASKSFTSLELTDAHLAAIEAARSLNAFVLETPDQARAMARAIDARIAKGEGGPLAGIPLGIKDLFATKDVRTTACSKILGNFVPPYEFTITSQLWRDGAVMLGKLNNDEFAMGSSNETVLRPGGQSVAARRPTPRWCRAARPADPHRRWRRCSAWARPRPTPAARSASPRPLPRRSASSRPMAAARAGASSPSRPRSTRQVRSRDHAGCRDPDALDGGHDPKDTTSSIARCRTTRPRSENPSRA